MQIECEDLIKIYGLKDQKNSKVALRGVNLAIKEKEFVSILGPSGSGKTTLLNILAGELYPTSGTVLIEGKKLNEMNPLQLNTYRTKYIGYISQFPEKNLILNMNVQKNILLSLKLLHIGSYSSQKKKAKEMLSILGLSQRKSSLISNLSGGEAQRVSIGAVLIRDPILIFADEPTGNLDSENSRIIFEFLKYINHDIAKTVVVVTHNELITKYTTANLILRDGKIEGYNRLNNEEKISQNEYELIHIDPEGYLRIPNYYRNKLRVKDEFVRMRFNEKDDCIEIKGNNID